MKRKPQGRCGKYWQTLRSGGIRNVEWTT